MRGPKNVPRRLVTSACFPSSSVSVRCACAWTSRLALACFLARVARSRIARPPLLLLGFPPENSDEKKPPPDPDSSVSSSVSSSSSSSSSPRSASKSPAASPIDVAGSGSGMASVLDS